MTTPEILEMLAEYYGKDDETKLTDRVAQVYLRTLDDIDPVILEEAAYIWIQEGKQFFPKVVELREVAKRVNFKRLDISPTESWQRAMVVYGRVLRGELPSQILEDRRYKKYLPQSASTYEDLSPEDKAFWDAITVEPIPMEIHDHVPA